MKPIATIILNRNLPEVTDRLFNYIEAQDGQLTDIFVVDAGSDDDKLSAHTTWRVNSPDVVAHGMRYARGMNFGLRKLWETKKFDRYEAFLLLTNDTEFISEKPVSGLIEVLRAHPRVGLLSPCGENWGERMLLNTEVTRYFWFIHNNAYLFRREFLEAIINIEASQENNFVFDGSNFRGYGMESEIIAKAYSNDWAAAITSQVLANENESYLLTKADLIKTEGFSENLGLYILEGKAWMRSKYGFNSHWQMTFYAKLFYDRFFENFPELKGHKI